MHFYHGSQFLKRSKPNKTILGNSLRIFYNRKWSREPEVLRKIQSTTVSLFLSKGFKPEVEK